MITFFSQNIYFLSAVLFFLLWLIIFVLNKTGRKQMLYISIATMFLGFFVQEMHFVDWWQPHFLFDTFIKIEDIFFGFGAGGVISGIYSILKSYSRNNRSAVLSKHSKIVLIIVFLFSLFGLFYIFNVHSFTSSIIALSLPLVVLAYKNMRLLPVMFLSAGIFTAFAFLGYVLAIHINPNFVIDTYLLEHLSGILIVGIPIEELLWFFFAGLGVPAVQELFFDIK